MYEARQNKEKVSRRIDSAGGMAKQRLKLKKENMHTTIPIIFKTATNKHKQTYIQLLKMQKVYLILILKTNIEDFPIFQRRTSSFTIHILS